RVKRTAERRGGPPMARELPNKIKVAAVEMAAAIGALAAAAGDYPVVAVVLVALGVAFFIANRLRSRSVASPLPDAASPSDHISAPPSSGDREQFIEVLQGKVEASQLK